MKPIIFSSVRSEGTLQNVDEKHAEIDVLVSEHQFVDISGNKAMIVIHHDKVEYREDMDGTTIIVPITLKLRGEFRKGDRVVLHNFVYEFIGGTEV